MKTLDMDAAELAALILQQYAIMVMKFRKKAAVEIEKSTIVGQRTVLGGQGVLPLMNRFFVVKYWAIVIAIMMAIARDKRREMKRCIIFRMRMFFLSFYFFSPEMVSLEFLLMGRGKVEVSRSSKKGTRLTRSCALS